MSFFLPLSPALMLVKFREMTGLSVQLSSTHCTKTRPQPLKVLRKLTNMCNVIFCHFHLLYMLAKVLRNDRLICPHMFCYLCQVQTLPIKSFEKIDKNVKCHFFCHFHLLQMLANILRYDRLIYLHMFHYLCQVQTLATKSFEKIDKNV